LDFIKRTNSFLALGQHLKNLNQEVFEDVFQRASYQNPWFTSDSIKLSIAGIINYLDEQKLLPWLKNYNLINISPKKIGVVMAGNIPMVGMHDLICILLSGHKAIVKLSSQDDVLIRFIINELFSIEPMFKEYIEFVDKLKGMDAVIATGSDNTSRYFEYYFNKYPHIIRKNRTSVAILNGEESQDELIELGHDIFSYFGLGCRNVSKLFLPAGYDIKKLLPYFEFYNQVVNHNKYGNNYFYNRSILLVNQTQHLDNGFALFQESEKLVSPISVIYYEYYEHIDGLINHLKNMDDKIQCYVTKEPDMLNGIPFGKAQMPEIWDFADNIDTMKFLTDI